MPIDVTRLPGGSGSGSTRRDEEEPVLPDPGGYDEVAPGFTGHGARSKAGIDVAKLGFRVEPRFKLRTPEQTGHGARTQAAVEYGATGAPMRPTTLDAVMAGQAEGDEPVISGDQIETMLGEMARLREYIRDNDADRLEEVEGWIGQTIKQYEDYLPLPEVEGATTLAEALAVPGQELVNRSDLVKEVLGNYGLDDIDLPDDPNLLQQALGSPLMQALNPVLRVLGRPGEASATIGAISNATGVNPLSPGSLVSAVTSGNTQPLEDMAAAAVRGVTNQDQPDDFYGYDIDTDGDGVINFREVLGVDADLGGSGWFGDYVVGTLDQIGLAAIDPTTYVGIGVAQRARAGLEAAEQVGGRALRRQIMEQGLRSVDDATREAIERVIREEVDAAFNMGRRWTRAQRRNYADDIARRQAEVLERVGAVETATGRLRFAGANFRSPVDPIANRNPLRTQFGELREAGNLLDTASSGLRRSIARIFGDGMDNVTPTANGLNVSGTLRRGSRDVGSATYKLLDDGTVIMDNFAIDPARRGRGIATEVLDEQVEALTDAGFHTIKMTAEGDGALMWGRRGFDYDFAAPDFENSMRITAQSLRDKAAELRAGRVVGASDNEADNFLDEIASEGFGGVRQANPDELKAMADQIDAALQYNQLQTLPDLGSDEWARIAGMADELRIPMVRNLDAAAGPGLERGGVRQFFDEGADTRQRFTADVERPSLLNRIPEGLRRPGDAIRPRAEIARGGRMSASDATAPRYNTGRATERVVDDVRVGVGAQAERQIVEMMDEMSSAGRAAAEEFTGDAATTAGRAVGRVSRPNGDRFLQAGIQDADEFVRAALEGDDQLARYVLRIDPDDVTPEEFAELAAKQLEAEGLPATARYLRTVSRWRQTVDQVAVEAGLPSEFLHNYYMPRQLTREGRQLVQNNARMRGDLLGANTRTMTDTAEEFGRQSQRTFMPNASVEEVNRALAQQYDLPAGTQVFSESVLGAFAARGRSAFRAAAEADLFRGLQNEIVDGTPLMLVDDGSRAVRDAAKRAGYETVATPGGNVFMPPEVAREFENIRKAIQSDEWTGKAGEFLKNWSQIWGAQATSPLIDGIGFHSRNAAGNVMLNALAGVVNPLDYARALQIQRTIGRAARRVRSGSSTWNTVWDDLGIDAGDRALIRGLQDNDILGSGFFDDILQGTADRARIYDILGNNVLIRSGRHLGNAVEDNARVAHYINKLNAPGGSPAAAARSVRKFLFDYGDLTNFERQLRYASRFYTFMRKNTGVQLWALLHTPGRAAQIAEATGEFGMSPLGAAQPDWSAERGDSIVNPMSMAGVVGGVDTPFSAAFDTFQPIQDLMNVLPGLKDIAPGEATGQDLVRSLTDLTSGGPEALLNFVYEQLTQKDTFTEADLENQGVEEKIRDLLDAIVGPAWGQLDRFVGRLTESSGNLSDIPLVGGALPDVGTPLGNNISEAMAEIGQEAAVLSNIFGLNVAPYGEQGLRSALYAINAELEGQLEEAPTLGDYRSTGAVPTPERERTNRARSVVLQEEIARLQTMGLDTTNLEAELGQELEKERQAGYQINSSGSYSTETDRYEEWAADQGFVNAEGEPLDDFRSKAHWNAANPENLRGQRADGTYPTLDEWQEWVDENYVRYNDDGTYSTRGSRLEDLAVANNLLTESGNPSTSNLVKALYNQQNPDEAYLNPDGEPIGYRDIPVVWPGSRFTEMRDWLLEQGAPINPAASSVARTYQEAYNRAHPDRPYYQPKQWLEQRVLPVQGVYELYDRDSNRTIEYWPAGMSEDNWWITDTTRSPDSAASPTSALRPASLPSATSALLTPRSTSVLQPDE